MEVLFKNATVITVCDDNFVVENAFLGIDDGKICYLSEKEPKIKAQREIDAKGKVIMPGLVNAHTHIPMSILRGYADDYSLQDWLYNHIFKAEAKLDEKCIEVGAKLTLLEMLMTGTTSITDMYFYEPKVCEVLLNAGMRGNLCNGALCFDKPYDAQSDNAKKEFDIMIEKYHNASNGRIKIDAGIHGEYTSNETLWKYQSELALEKGLNIHVHISETKAEHDECKARHGGKTPVQILEESGVFKAPTTLAHCVHIEEEDMEIIAKNGGSVAHNPVSNLKLASGIAPVAKMLEKGVNVCLGTDGVASNNTHDLFEELKLSAILAKGITYDAKKVPAKEAIKMATINGAKSQNRDNVGQIKEGFDADLIMIDFSNISHTPCYDVLSAVVYNTSGRDVCLTMIQGKILYEDGKFSTLNPEEIISELKTYVLPRIKKD